MTAVRKQIIDGKVSYLKPSGFSRIPDIGKTVFRGDLQEGEWIDEETNEIWIIVGQVGN